MLDAEYWLLVADFWSEEITGVKELIDSTVLVQSEIRIPKSEILIPSLF